MRAGSDRPAAILDVDGTLVDTNYQHALAWQRAFRHHGLQMPAWRIHRHVGMGGDQVIAAIAGDDVEGRLGDDIRAAEAVLYRELIHEAVALPGAFELIDELKRRGQVVVLASSGKQEEVDHYLDVLGAREVVDGWTTSADVDRTKPHPDLVERALLLAGRREAVFVGDTPWDCLAAARAGIACIGLLCGGFAESELIEAGAVAVFETPLDLVRNLDETALA